MGIRARAAISYQSIDVSEPGALEELGRQSFDAAVCNMGLMDMPDIEPLAKAIPALLKRKGKFVFSVTHPCFNTSDMRKVATESEEGGVAKVTYGVEIRRYLTGTSEKGLAMMGQPEPQIYFERPLVFCWMPSWNMAWFSMPSKSLLSPIREKRLRVTGSTGRTSKTYRLLLSRVLSVPR